MISIVVVCGCVCVVVVVINEGGERVYEDSRAWPTLLTRTAPLNSQQRKNTKLSIYISGCGVIRTPHPQTLAFL